MLLTVLGSNGTYPTPGRPASGYLVGDGATIWMDAGPGTLVALLERAAIDDIDALVLSHGHGDHCLDVIPLLNLLRYGRPRRRRLPVYTPEGVAERLAAFVGAGPGHDFFEVFDFATVVPGSVAEVGGLRLSWGGAVHPVPAVVTRVESGGVALAYSGDTGPGGDLVEMATDVDLLLCEATGQGSRGNIADRAGRAGGTPSGSARRAETPSPEGKELDVVPDSTLGDYPYHLYAVEAGQVASASGARRLLVTHIAPTLDEAESVAQAAAAFGGPVEWAAPGLEVEL